MARRDEQSLQIRVDEAKQRDVGKRRARLGAGSMNRLGLKSGDVIEITGTRSSCAVVWPLDEDDKSTSTIRIDGQTRKNAGASLQDMVVIRRTVARPAKAAVLKPVSEAAAGDEEFTDFIKNRLRGLPMTEEDYVSVMILGNFMEFKISKTSPKGTVRMEQSTAITISEEAAAPDKKTSITYEEVGGLREEIRSMREIVELPLRHPELFTMLGIEPHSGILLYGPPGCGKTLLARVLASESEADMFLINGPEIMNKYYGESEAKLREIFKEARDASPSIVFIDEIDAIAPKREDVHGDVEKRVVAQLLALMDGLDDRGRVIILGATNRPDSVDPALRRPGRFDREFEIPTPNEDGRLEILFIHTRGMPLAEGTDLRELASELHGYTGADIRSLCSEAAMKSIRRYLQEIDLDSERIPSEILQSMRVGIEDFYDAMHEVVPTIMREVYVEKSKVQWSDVGGLDAVKESLVDNLVIAMNEPGKFAAMGIRPPGGALIYGPPGCGKTLLGRALATRTGANMILVRGPEILSKWVGESEKAVREIFRKAKASSPCVIIFDELDSLARYRTRGVSAGAGLGGGSVSSSGGGGDSGSETSETILSQLLTEIEDTPSRVAVIGITSRPDMLDSSFFRAGRLDLTLYAAPPDEKGRRTIMSIITKKMPLDSDVCLDEIAVATQGYTGADLTALCREAAVSAMKRDSSTISNNDFSGALKRAKPSITQEMVRWYAAVGEDISNTVHASNDKVFYG